MGAYQSDDAGCRWFSWQENGEDIFSWVVDCLAKIYSDFPRRLFMEYTVLGAICLVILVRVKIECGITNKIQSFIHSKLGH